MPATLTEPRVAAGFGLRLDCKKWFFDREAVKAMMDAKTRAALSRAGAVVRGISRRSMKYVSAPKAGLVMGGVNWAPPIPQSPVGSPPNAIRPHPWIRKNLEFAVDPVTRSVVIGPIILPGVLGGRNIPAIHERGGRARNRNPRRMTRKLGGVGEIRLGGPSTKGTNTVRNTRGNPVQVTHTRLRTNEQVRRANMLNALLYGPLWREAVYPRRPYMGPAVAEAAPQIPWLWAEGTSRVVGVEAD